MLKFTKLFLFSLVLAYAITMLACSGKPSIDLNEDWVQPGKTIQVKWDAPVSQQKSGAWIGVVPAVTPADDKITHDNADLQYKTLDGKSSGKFELRVPNGQGKYELRIYDSETNGKVLASTPFTVSNSIEM